MEKRTCPIYRSENACQENPGCMFLRAVGGNEPGCAIPITLSASEQTFEAVRLMEQKIVAMDKKLNTILSYLQS